MKKEFTPVFFDYNETGQLEVLVQEYLENNPSLEPFYRHKPDLSSFDEAIRIRRSKPVDRNLLVNVLNEQYAIISPSQMGPVGDNIHSLLNENTYTVTTGHQLCLFTGPLYFIYKIFSSINLANRLNEQYPDQKFVPVFWMAGEDHDTDEINHLHLFSGKVTWSADQKGPSGRMSTEGLFTFFGELQTILGQSENADSLKKMFQEAYLGHSNLADATRFLVHHIFGKYGLLILDADHMELKKKFVPVMKDDILLHSACRLVNETIRHLEPRYKIQVRPRDINLFYMEKGLRERILKDQDGNYIVNNTSLVFTAEGLSSLLEDRPDKFSPNVVLRPLYQETILPDIACIGGPGEIAYWLEYLSTFDYYKIPFPVLILRNCILILDKEIASKIKDFGFSFQDIFLDREKWAGTYIKNKLLSNDELNLETERKTVNELFEKLRKKGGLSDPGLIPFINGEEQKMIKALGVLEQKIVKSQKRKHEVSLNQVKNLKEKLFPDGIPQERYYNFSMFFLKYGENFFNQIRRHVNPLNPQYLLLIENQDSGPD